MAASLSYSRAFPHASAGGFDVCADGDAFALIDRDRFNNWGVLKPRFATVADAVDHAERCDAFKRGQRMQVDLSPWEIADRAQRRASQEGR